MYDTVASISCIIAADCSRGTLCKEAPFSDSDIMILGMKVCTGIGHTPKPLADQLYGCRPHATLENI